MHQHRRVPSSCVGTGRGSADAAVRNPGRTTLKRTCNTSRKGRATCQEEDAAQSRTVRTDSHHVDLGREMVVAIGKDGHSTCPDHGPKASVDQRRGSLLESGAAVQLAAWVESVEWRRRRLPEVLRKLVDSVGVCLPIPLGPHRFVTPVGVGERAQKREPSPGGRR